MIGFAFDGTGYGTDGAVWGGEVLVAGYKAFRRVGAPRLRAAGRRRRQRARPYRMALAHLRAAGVDWTADLPPVAAARRPSGRVLAHQLDTGLGCVPTSSMGRLFDAVVVAGRRPARGRLRGRRRRSSWRRWPGAGGRGAVRVRRRTGRRRSARPGAGGRGRSWPTCGAACRPRVVGAPVPRRASPRWSSAGAAGRARRPGSTWWRWPAACSGTRCCSATAHGADGRRVHRAAPPPAAAERRRHRAGTDPGRLGG